MKSKKKGIDEAWEEYKAKRKPIEEEYIAKIKFTLIIFITITIALALSFIFIGLLSIRYDMEGGDYLVQNQWIASEYGNKTVCEECLMIEFYEGCNRNKVYIFANEHEFNPALKIGTPVNINYVEIEGEKYIRGVMRAKRYRSKC